VARYTSIGRDKLSSPSQLFLPQLDMSKKKFYLEFRNPAFYYRRDSKRNQERVVLAEFSSKDTVPNPKYERAYNDGRKEISEMQNVFM